MKIKLTNWFDNKLMVVDTDEVKWIADRYSHTEINTIYGRYYYVKETNKEIEIIIKEEEFKSKLTKLIE